MARPCPSRSIARTRHIRGMSTLSADIILYQSCCTAASGGGVSTWTAASSCARGFSSCAAGFAGGEAFRCEPASCCEPAALSCWQIAEWLVGGYAPGRSAAASAHATRGALSGQHSRAAESRVGVLRPSHSSPRAAAVDSSSLTAKVTVVLHHTPGVRGTVAPAQKASIFRQKV